MNERYYGVADLTILQQGYQVQDFLSGSMHSHVLNFKADFDILGQSNSVQLMSVVPTTKTYPCEFFPLFYLAPLAFAGRTNPWYVPFLTHVRTPKGPWARRETP